MEDNTVKPHSPKWWMKHISEASEELEKKWKRKARKIVNRYLDERMDEETGGPKSKYNVFWANIQILKSALYANPPKPTVTRQFGDDKDDVARTAALIMERLLDVGITRDESDLHNAFKQAVEDRLIPGLGQTWLRLDVTTEEQVDPTTQQVFKVIKSQKVHTDYVNWEDFFWSPARTWTEVWWVARRVWMRQHQVKKRFGKEKYKIVQDASQLGDKNDGYPKGFVNGRLEVFEIWCLTTRRVYWIAKNIEEELDSRDDPLRLDNFFPCPHPLLATHTSNSLVPRPDYRMAQDQYKELDILNDRINTLTRALRVVGAYDKNNTELSKMLTGAEFNMIPVENWAMLSESGGIAKAVDWFPVEQVSKVLQSCVEQRQLVIGQIYELTGISDIMRGNSNPRETAKAQTLKAQYSSVRLQLIQLDVAQFIRHTLRLKAEIISKHFVPEQIVKQSAVEFTQSAQYIEPALELIKNWEDSKFRVEINDEALSLADYNAERELRVEALTAVGQFFSQAGQIAQAAPGALPYLIKMVQWTMASFRGSADIETVLDEAAAAATQNPPQPPGQEGKPQQPPPDNITPAKIKAEADVRIAEMETQRDLKLAEMEGQLKMILAKQDEVMKVKDMLHQIQLLIAKQQSKATLEGGE